MIEKMYSIMSMACEKASTLTGVSIRFPKPSKRAWAVSTVLNGAMGVGLLLFGFLSPYKWVLLFGALGLAGSAIAGIQVKNLFHAD